MKMVIKSCPLQQMTEKFAVEVDEKFVLGKCLKICKYLYLMRMFKGFSIMYVGANMALDNVLQVNRFVIQPLYINQFNSIRVVKILLYFDGLG